MNTYASIRNVSSDRRKKATYVIVVLRMVSNIRKITENGLKMSCVRITWNSHGLICLKFARCLKLAIDFEIFATYVIFLLRMVNIVRKMTENGLKISCVRMTWNSYGTWNTWNSHGAWSHLSSFRGRKRWFTIFWDLFFRVAI